MATQNRLGYRARWSGYACQIMTKLWMNAACVSSLAEWKRGYGKVLATTIDDEHTRAKHKQVDRHHQ